MKPTEPVRVTVLQVDAQEQRAARETAETQLTAAQARITTLEQKIIELQAQLPATSRPNVSFCVGFVTFTSHFHFSAHMLSDHH